MLFSRQNLLSTPTTKKKKNRGGAAPLEHYGPVGAIWVTHVGTRKSVLNKQYQTQSRRPWSSRVQQYKVDEGILVISPTGPQTIKNSGTHRSLSPLSLPHFLVSLFWFENHKR